MLLAKTVVISPKQWWLCTVFVVHLTFVVLLISYVNVIIFMGYVFQFMIILWYEEAVDQQRRTAVCKCFVSFLVRF